MRYETLVRILDTIRAEAPPTMARYQGSPEMELEKVNQARSRAFIHLYLKVMFGLADFMARERTITDGAFDGGIDGYHIDPDAKVIYLVQSKFRTSGENFESKEIALEELLAMDALRILEGETHDEAGNEYNGKIKQLQREVSKIPDVARYSYKVAILANLPNISQSKLKVLTGGLAAEVFDFEKTYQKLLFPVITGTYFTASDIVIPIDLSNKNAGSKISYNVKTKYSDCEITVLFVPTYEIARVMDKYRNAILKYNPRSYLDLEGRSVNASIRDTIVATTTNEFALYNNGITMLSEETNINEKIGQKNKAQLRIKNPQIINGGQTSFTLSRVLEEQGSNAAAVFSDKEVLLKIITLADSSSQEAKLQLIDEISNATNKQTPVLNADRFANEAFHVAIQHKIFDRYGLLYERKRGEFSAGVNDGYVDEDNLVERNLYWRLYYTANGDLQRGTRKRLFQSNQFADIVINTTPPFDRAYLAFKVYKQLRQGSAKNVPIEPGLYARIYMYVALYFREGTFEWDQHVEEHKVSLMKLWIEFLGRLRKNGTLKKRAYIDAGTGEARIRYEEPRYANTNFGQPKAFEELSAFIEEARMRPEP